MGRFIVRRLVGMVVVLFAVSVLVFLIFNVIPNSDPAQRHGRQERDAGAGQPASKKNGASTSRCPQQYVTMMKKVFTGDLISYSSRLNVDEQIIEGDPGDLLALHRRRDDLDVLRHPLRLPLGGAGPGGWLDRALTILALVGISMPVFWLGADPPLLPHLQDRDSSPTAATCSSPKTRCEWANHLILPWITLAVLSIGFYSRVLRSNMLDVMNEDYVRTARAKGLSERQVMTRHVLRNSLIPIVTLFGLDFGAADRRRRDHHRSRSSASTASASTRPKRSATSTCRRSWR